MSSTMKDAWLRCGYALFARQGPPGLKVEVLARRLGRNKSAFYHYFADLEVFTEQLLRYHLERAHELTERERQCRNIVPELLHVIVAAEEDLLFNRQLRNHRADPAFRACVAATDRQMAEALLPVWAASFDLADRPLAAQLLLQLVVENFFLQLTGQALTYEWLLGYIGQLQAMVRALAVTIPVPSPALDGTV